MFASLGIVFLAFALSACGNAEEGPSASEPPNNLVARSEVAQAPKGGVKQAFLEFWSALQFQAWAEAASYYDPSFRTMVGTATIIGGKKLNAPSYPELKPSSIEITSRGGITTVNYSLWLADGTKELASTSWHKVDGVWQIVYDSRLDAEISQAAINRVEIDLNGTLPTELDDISAQAARAGARAARAQARFVEKQLDLEQT